MKNEVLALMRNLRESPGAKEAAIRVEQQLAERDPEVRAFVETFHFDADRGAALARFLATPFPGEVLAAIRRRFGGRKDLRICEVGAGDGFLAVALVRAGYALDILEPSAELITGTGYLRTLPEATSITIHNDLDAWYADAETYDLILTNACIHHFHNPQVVASQIRMKTSENGLWLAFTEYCAYDVEDTLSQLNQHRHAVLYGLYEWPYSPALYAAMLEAAGFRRGEIVPALPTILRPVWSLIAALRVSWFAHGVCSAIARRVARRQIRLIDPLYMAFRAAPLRWPLVERGYLELEPSSCRRD